MNIRKIVLFFCLMMGLCNFKAQAHDPYLYSSVIVHGENGWSLKMTFGSSGLIEAMNSYYSNEEISLSQTNDIKVKIHDYVISHIDIKVNKYFTVDLANFNTIVTDHAIEVNFTLTVPPAPQYWDISITACKENRSTTNMLRIISEGESYLFKLSKKSGLSILLISTKEGDLKQIKS